jgi:hypothetical protein
MFELLTARPLRFAPLPASAVVVSNLALIGLLLIIVGISLPTSTG